MEDKKVGFFSRIKIAVTKLENYGMFVEEKTSVAVKYFFLIVLLLTIVMGAVETYSIMKIVNKGYSYVKNEIPEFSYSEGKLEFSENVHAYDHEFDLYMIADTSEEVSEEKMTEYRDEIKSQGIIFLKDKAIYKSGIDEVEYNYAELASESGITDLNKEKMINEIDAIGLTGIAVTIFLTLFVGLYIIELITIFMDWLVITIFALVAARICGINMPFKAGFNISIYALTLSIILTILYNVAYYLAGFYTDYFRLVYLLISYVYVVAAILMMKSDLIKQQMEVTKIEEVQKKVHEELKEQEKEEDKKENKKPEDQEDKKEETDDNIAGEPDGSEI